MKKYLYLIISADLHNYVGSGDQECMPIERCRGSYVVVTSLLLGQLRQSIEAYVGDNGEFHIFSVEDSDVFFTNNAYLRNWVNDKFRPVIAPVPENTAPEHNTPNNTAPTLRMPYVTTPMEKNNY